MSIFDGSALAELCKRDFYTFVQNFWSCADTSTPVWNWHMKVLADEAQLLAETLLSGKPKEYDLLFNCPPGTSKSMILSVLFPAWLFARKPSIRIITASYSSATSIELSIKTRNLMQSDKYMAYFPNVRLKDDESAKGHYKTTALGGRLATSTGSNVIGMHGDIHIWDDIQNLDAVYSDLGRLRVNRWGTGTLSTRKTDKINTPTVGVQQKLHPLDYSAHWLSLGTNIRQIVLPVMVSDIVQPKELIKMYNDNGGFLDSQRLGLAHQIEAQKMLGTINYNAQFKQSPEDESTAIIKRDWLIVTDTIPDTEDLFYFLDTAYGGALSDYSVILECFTKNNNLYITNVVRTQAEFPDLIKLIKESIQAQKVKKIYIEGKASGKSIVQTLRQETKFNIVELQPQGSKLERLNAVSPAVEGERVYVLNKKWTGSFLDEICSNYPVNDDQRDCFTYAVQELLIKNENYGRYTIL